MARVKVSSSIRASPGPVPPAFSPDAGPVGLLLLDTRFVRAPGDLGRPDSWPMRMMPRVVRDARPSNVVRASARLQVDACLPAFAQAARALHGERVRAITTSCGFLVLLQAGLQAAVPVPVVTSSLLLLPGLLQLHPQVGVLTIDAASLGEAHLRSAGVPGDRLRDVVVQGVDPQGSFARGILDDSPGFDTASAGNDVVQAALALQRRRPGLRAVVLECTNMPPFGARVREATGWTTVLDLADAVALRLRRRDRGP